MLDTEHRNPGSIPGMDHSNKEWTRQLLDYINKLELEDRRKLPAGATKAGNKTI
jgi:hypothetical protein